MIKRIFSIFLITFLLSSGSALAVWSDPTAVAPGANTERPIDEGSASQFKAGGLSIASLIVSGGTTLGNTAATCDVSIDGTVRFENGVLEICSNESQSGGTGVTSVDPGLPPTCSNGQISMYNPVIGDWECADTPEALSDCANGEVVRYNTTTSLWECTPFASKFIDGTNPNDAVYTTGNVGIGTSNPTAAKLQVEVSAEGTAGLVLKSGVNTYLEVTPELSGNYRTVLDTINNRHLILDTGTGNVGIGSDTPTEGKLVINNSVTGPAGWGTSIVFDNNSHNAIWNPAGGLYFGLHSDGGFYWGDESGGTHQSYPMILDSDTGNLSNYGWITTGNSLILNAGRNIFFGTGSMNIYGDSTSIFYMDSDHSTLTQLIMRDLEDTIYGRVYGAGDGTQFGFLDGDGHWSLHILKDTYIRFLLNNSEKMRIESTGDVGIGITNPAYRLHVEDDRPNNYMVKFKNLDSSGAVDLMYLQLGVATPSTGAMWLSFRDSGGTQHGSVNANGGGGVNYNTTSDRRLKKNIAPLGLDEATNMTLTSQPVKFDWKESGQPDMGYIAQDLKKVLPLAVSGDENEMEMKEGEGGKLYEGIKYMTVSSDSLIPVIHAALAGSIYKTLELEDEVSSRKTRREALEEKIKTQQAQINLLLTKLNN